MSKQEYEALSALLDHELGCQKKCLKCIALEAALVRIRREEKP